MKASSIPLFTVLLLAACSRGSKSWSSWFTPNRGGEPLSYAHYKSLETGTLATEIRDKFGPPAGILERDAAIRAMTYRCKNAAGKVTELRLGFDAEQRLRASVLLDPGVVRDKATVPARKETQDRPGGVAVPKTG